MVNRFFDKKTSSNGISNDNIPNKESTEQLHKPIIRKFKKIIVSSPFIDNIPGADLADMQLISKFNKEFKFLLHVLDIYGKYTWVILLKGKKGITITNAFQKILDQSNPKPNKIWADKDSEFYNRSMKSWLEKKDIEMYSPHSEGNSVIAQRFIRTLKNKIYKYMTSVLKNACIDKTEEIVDK